MLPGVNLDSRLVVLFRGSDHQKAGSFLALKRKSI
jgi:hypothetical protein